jgi:uncharacterized protein YndB with AHSA1/START domain
MNKTSRPRATARMSDDAVRAKTGKTWPEWFAVLDAAGCRKMTHQEIVACLRDQHGLGPWWQQMVTVGYEQERGLREKHEKPDGYSISASRTIAVPLADLYGAWHDKRKRGRWLSDDDFTVRKATANKSLRITWGDGTTSVEVNFVPKGEAKSQVAVQHDKLADAKAAERQKVYWREALDRLQALLEK